jgi:hypothetical protein
MPDLNAAMLRLALALGVGLLAAGTFWLTS